MGCELEFLDGAVFPFPGHDEGGAEGGTDHDGQHDCGTADEGPPPDVVCSGGDLVDGDRRLPELGTPVLENAVEAQTGVLHHVCVDVVDRSLQDWGLPAFNGAVEVLGNGDDQMDTSLFDEALGLGLVAGDDGEVRGDVAFRVLDRAGEGYGVVAAGLVDQTDVPLIAAEAEEHGGDEHQHDGQQQRREESLVIPRPLLQVFGDGSSELVQTGGSRALCRGTGWNGGVHHWPPERLL